MRGLPALSRVPRGTSPSSLGARVASLVPSPPLWVVAVLEVLLSVRVYLFFPGILFFQGIPRSRKRRRRRTKDATRQSSDALRSNLPRQSCGGALSAKTALLHNCNGKPHIPSDSAYRPGTPELSRRPTRQLRLPRWFLHPSHRSSAVTLFTCRCPFVSGVRGLYTYIGPHIYLSPFRTRNGGQRRRLHR